MSRGSFWRFSKSRGGHDCFARGSMPHCDIEMGNAAPFASTASERQTFVPAPKGVVSNRADRNVCPPCLRVNLKTDPSKAPRGPHPLIPHTRCRGVNRNGERRKANSNSPPVRRQSPISGQARAPRENSTSSRWGHRSVLQGAFQK